MANFTVPNLDFDRIRLATDGVGGFSAYYDEIRIAGQWEDIVLPEVPVLSRRGTVAISVLLALALTGILVFGRR